MENVNELEDAVIRGILSDDEGNPTGLLVMKDGKTYAIRFKAEIPIDEVTV